MPELAEGRPSQTALNGSDRPSEGSPCKVIGQGLYREGNDRDEEDPPQESVAQVASEGRPEDGPAERGEAEDEPESPIDEPLNGENGRRHQRREDV